MRFFAPNDEDCTQMSFVVEQHDPAWLVEFEHVRAHLSDALRGVDVVAIEHVGSTSIHGLPAKPVIDVDCVVRARHLSAARTALSKAGYLDLGEMNIPGRYAFRQPGFGASDFAGTHATTTTTTTTTKQGATDHTPLVGFQTPLGLRRNTYVMVEGTQALRNHLDVKRVLLDDAALRKEYGEVKMRLANDASIQSIGDYVRGKTDILAKILRKAGWSDDELDELRLANSSDEPRGAK